jgi:hypothetical protein
MSEPKFSKTPIDLKAVKRPKGYATFTSLKGTTGIYIQKGPRYQGEKHGSRELVTDLVSASVQRGVEFDAYTLFLGSEDGKRPANPTFAKLATQGFLRNGERVYVGPDYLQEVLEAQVSASTNRIIRWKDRPRSSQEIALEKALETEVSKRMASDMEVEKLRALLSKNKIEIPKE